MGLWVKERGESKGRPVIGRIEGITPLTRKRADFRVVFHDEST